MPPSEPTPTASFYLIVADHDRGFLQLERQRWNVLG
jgi:hypothetical protein